MKILNKYTALVFLICSLVLVLFAVIDCKKKSEPASPVEVKETVEAMVEQKICPIMGAPINKDLYVEYRGKKVYFCCNSCQEKFKAEPEKYLSKLPQFNN